MKGYFGANLTLSIYGAVWGLSNDQGVNKNQSAPF